ncbi:hypothetical protein TIFTF001_001737 [Ficus carica]|uniref:Uncharacterized protein n=1 Tax=Ficus carica TaxID=3494 RepID=A0AA87Z1A4_FICCA|nr:hypothetical protein TIFTF001_001737 [Ficus carica]
MMVNYLCSLRKLLVPWLILVGFLGLGYSFSIFLTSTILILSTIFFPFPKPKPVDPIHENENPPEKIHVLNLISSDHHQKFPIPHLEDQVKEPQEEEKEEETTPQMKEAQQHQDMMISHSASSHNSESECSTLDHDHSSTTEDSEAEWPFGRKSAVFSDDDGSISDEESLIEIALPSGHYVGHNHHHPHLFPDCIFKQRSLIMELLAEINNDINEEDNLIEIDISMGSIKCSRFEIEA